MASQLGLSRLESDLLYDQYDAAFPEARQLMAQAMDAARSRGFVKTILGRRARFPGGDRLHSALNRVIQGTAADILKMKLLEVYNNRHDLGIELFMTVHDELDGAVDSPTAKVRMKELLDAPILGIRVPLTWDVKVGNSWAA